MPEPDLRTSLRVATRADHARVDALFREGFTARDDYGAYLAGMQALLAPLGPSLPETAAFLPLIADDLCVLGLTASAPAPAPCPPQPAPDADDTAALLGWRYVIHGSSLGARVLLRQAAALGAGPARGARFLGAHAAGEHWQDALIAIDTFAGEREAVITAARAAFAAAESAFRRSLAATPGGVPA